MKRKLFFLFLTATFLFSSFAFAQVNYEDVLYLKNGSIIHGVIIEQVPNVSIKIQTKDMNVFVFSMDEVLKIAKEEVAVGGRKQRAPLTKDNVKKRGFQNITEVTLGRDVLGNNDQTTLGNSDGILPTIGIQTVNGYMFNPYISAGIGLGLHMYYDPGFVPVYLDLRLNFSNGPVTPYVSVDAGYSFTVKEVYGLDPDKKYFGGAYFNPAIGIKIYCRKYTALAMSFGYRQQESRFYNIDYGDYPYYNETGTWEDLTLGYFVTSVGVVF